MTPPRLAQHTTLRVGGPATEWVVATTETELIQAVSSADAAGMPVLVLGGGSNLVVADAGFDGRVVQVATRGVHADSDHPDDIGCLGAVTVTVAAGEPWDEFVAHCVEHQWTGLETMSGIPGLVGATPIQNVGAYGQEVATTIARVRTWDRHEHTQRTFMAADCGFDYRTSRFKTGPDRYLILEVTFLLRQGTHSTPIAYTQLADHLGVKEGQRVPLPQVRQAVLQLRRSKGMVLDEADHDTWSAGSFFTNPIIDPALLPEDAPAWPQPDGRVKTSAAWLIEQAGFSRGYGAGAVQLSSRHTLAITNRGRGTAAEVMALARELRAGVQQRFGIDLVNEPVLVGCSL